MGTFQTKEHFCDFCVVGGGLAGTVAALAAARQGLKVVLIQDRPVLGGNSSSEIRVWVRGAKGIYNKETGILGEFEEENIYRNPTLAPTLWDSVLYGKIKENPNITLLLNASCMQAECEFGRIHSVTAWQLTTYTWQKVHARFFADCSGDSVLAPLTGAAHRIGREAKEEYGESIAQDVADEKGMGMCCFFSARETDHPVKFTPPAWANVYKTDEDFAVVSYKVNQLSTFRDHAVATSGTNFWWMELGGDGEAIVNTEETRDELVKIVFGIWDHIKNYGDHGYENWELDWVGFLPGKRESVRYIGEHVLKQSDIEAGGIFDDVVAYGGWPMDSLNPLGMKANSFDELPSQMHPAPSPYGISYRCLYSSNIDNLFFAGRNISATHVGMSSIRVMGTCALMGQAIGTAAAICEKNGLRPRDLRGDYVRKLQTKLQEDGVFLPGLPRKIPAVSLEAKLNLGEEQREVLFNGIERPRSETERNEIILPKGASITFDWNEAKPLHELRVQFDRDWERTSVTPNFKMQVFPMKLNEGKDFVPVKVADTIVRSFAVYADGIKVYETDNNYHALVKVPLAVEAKQIEVKFIETWGKDEVHLFACDVK